MHEPVAVTKNPRDNEAWLRDLAPEAAGRDEAIGELRGYLLRVVLVYLLHRRSELARLRFEEVRQLAEDWAQLATLKVLDELAGFRGDSRFTTWAYRIAINVAAADLRRRRWTERSLDDASMRGDGDDEESPSTEPRAPEPGPDAMADRSAAWSVIRQAMAEDLTERQRQVLTRVVLEGQPPDEAAEAMGTNRNNVYKLLHDARSSLRRAIERRGWHPEEILASFASPT
jgi:RNA polymerase sigma-70 factor (ECF subfamily)